MDITGYAFVTGGGSGIGKACCLAFAKAGARGLLVADINVDAAKKTADEAKAAAAACTTLDFRAEAVHIDIADESSVQTAVEKMVELFGRVDYCVHSAGVSGGSHGSIAGNNFSDFKRTLDINVNGTYLITNLVSVAMKAQEPKQNDASSVERGFTRGTIVILGSVSSMIANPGMVQYTTAKHAIMGISKTAAIDNVSFGIRVNCICPSWIDTPMVQRSFELVPGLEQTLLDGAPMGRLGRSEEVADAALFLCSPKSSFITGCGLIIDGGMTLSTKT